MAVQSPVLFHQAAEQMAGASGIVLNSHSFFDCTHNNDSAIYDMCSCFYHRTCTRNSITQFIGCHANALNKSIGD